MILDWLAQTPALLAAMLVVFVPGVIGLYLVGLRGLALLAASPLVSAVSASAIAVIYGAFGIGWSPLTWGIGTIVILAVAAGLGRMLGGRLTQTTERSAAWVLPAVLAFAAAYGAWRLATYITDPGAVSQTNDAVFHMNALKFIVETADASSLHISEVIGAHSFYPAAWHDITTMVASLSGASLPIAANVVSLVIGALIWPLGIAWLTRTVTGSDTVTAYATILSGVLQTFPLLMFQWGVLFPNALSTAMIPASVALVISLPMWTATARGWRVVVRTGIIVLLVVGALAFSQPASLLPWAAIIVVWFTARLVIERSAHSRKRRLVLIGGAWTALGILWYLIGRGTTGSHWQPFRNPLEALVDVLLNGQVLVPYAIIVSLMMICGLVVAWRTRSLRWIAFAWLGVSVLYVLVATVGSFKVRTILLGAWYADPYRIAALAPMVVIPLAAIGVHSIAKATDGSIRRWRNPASAATWSLLPAGILMVFVTVLVIVRPISLPSAWDGEFDRQSRYLERSSSYLSPDERELLERLPDLVEPGSRVLGNPSAGAAFGYFFSGIDVFPRTWSPPRSASWITIADHLRDVATEPAVCDALARFGNPGYVLDFGASSIGSGKYEMPGLTGFASRRGFEEVTRVGGASLWRITACAQ